MGLSEQDAWCGWDAEGWGVAEDYWEWEDEVEFVCGKVVGIFSGDACLWEKFMVLMGSRGGSRGRRFGQKNQLQERA